VYPWVHVTTFTYTLGGLMPHDDVRGLMRTISRRADVPRDSAAGLISSTLLGSTRRARVDLRCGLTAICRRATRGCFQSLASNPRCLRLVSMTRVVTAIYDRYRYDKESGGSGIVAMILGRMVQLAWIPDERSLETEGLREQRTKCAAKNRLVHFEPNPFATLCSRAARAARLVSVCSRRRG
jgi:hypothetical protein